VGTARFMSRSVAAGKGSTYNCAGSDPRRERLLTLARVRAFHMCGT
jgi:hypothetical protein